MHFQSFLSWFFQFTPFFCFLHFSNQTSCHIHITYFIILLNLIHSMNPYQKPYRFYAKIFTVWLCIYAYIAVDFTWNDWHCVRLTDFVLQWKLSSLSTLTHTVSVSQGTFVNAFSKNSMGSFIGNELLCSVCVHVYAFIHVNLIFVSFFLLFLL